MLSLSKHRQAPFDKLRVTVYYMLPCGLMKRTPCEEGFTVSGQTGKPLSKAETIIKASP